MHTTNLADVQVRALHVDRRAATARAPQQNLEAAVNGAQLRVHRHRQGLLVLEHRRARLRRHAVRRRAYLDRNTISSGHCVE